MNSLSFDGQSDDWIAVTILPHSHVLRLRYCGAPHGLQIDSPQDSQPGTARLPAFEAMHALLQIPWCAAMTAVRLCTLHVFSGLVSKSPAPANAEAQEARLAAHPFRTAADFFGANRLTTSGEQE